MERERGTYDAIEPGGKAISSSISTTDILFNNHYNRRFPALQPAGKQGIDRDRIECNFGVFFFVCLLTHVVGKNKDPNWTQSAAKWGSGGGAPVWFAFLLWLLLQEMTNQNLAPLGKRERESAGKRDRQTDRQSNNADRRIWSIEFSLAIPGGNDRRKGNHPHAGNNTHTHRHTSGISSVPKIKTQELISLPKKKLYTNTRTQRIKLFLK